MKIKERCKDEVAVTVPFHRIERRDGERERGEERVPKSWGEAESQIQHLHLVGPQNPPHWIHGTQLVNQPGSIPFQRGLVGFRVEKSVLFHLTFVHHYSLLSLYFTWYFAHGCQAIRRQRQPPEHPDKTAHQPIYGPFSTLHEIDHQPLLPCSSFVPA